MRPPFSSFDWLRTQLACNGYPLAIGTLTALSVLAAVTREDLGLPFTLAAYLLVPSQVCLIVLWAILARDHPAVRVSRTFLWSGGLYFCIVGPASLNPRTLPAIWPLGVGLAMTALAGGAALGALVIRSSGWRLADASLARAPDVPPRRSQQFRLADALAWITMLCVFLGLGVLTIPRFAAGEPVPISSASNVLGPLAGGAISGLVVGAIGALIFWLELVDAAAFRSFFRRYWQILLLVLLAALWLDRGGPFGMGPPPFQFVFAIVFGFGFPLAINTALFRAFGWRLATYADRRGGGVAFYG